MCVTYSKLKRLLICYIINFRRGFMFCPKCGNEVNDNYEFCYKYGSKIEEDSFFKLPSQHHLNIH